MPRFSKHAIIRLLSQTFLSLVFLATLLVVSAQPASAEGLTGPNSPSKWDNINKDGGVGSGTELNCKFDDSATVFCENNETATNHNATKYYFDPVRSAAAGHDVFTPSNYGPDQGSDNDNKAGEPDKWGVVHFPESATGNYGLLYISKSATEWEGGTKENDVDTANISSEPDDADVCNIEKFRGDQEKSVTCTTGWTDPPESVTATYKTTEPQLVKKCDKGGLGFVLCPIQEMMIDVVSQLNEWLANLLDINTEGFQNETLKEASQNILNLTNAIYAIIFLVIIFANGLSIGIDSYALKKMVPRLVAAIILSQFAFFITGAFIEIGNILGRGITAFFASIVPETANRAGAGGALALGVLTAGAVLVAISMLVIVIIALLVVLAVLAIRWAILYALILVAPLAFAAHVLPNTDKLWKLWWTNLVKLVMMFPIIMAITSGAAFLGAIMVNSDSPGAIQVVGALLPFIGFLLIPKAFKWSGNIMAATGGKVAEYGTKRAKSSAKEGAQAKLTNKGIETGLKIPVLGKAVGNSKTLGTAIHKNMGQREKRIDSKQGLDSVSGSRLEKMAAAGHKGAKDEIQKKYSEELDKQETRARQGLSVDATKLVKLRTVLGGSEGSVEQTNRANLEASRLGNAAQQYVNDAPPGAAPREMPEIRYNKPGEKAPANAPAGTPDPQRNYFGGTPIVQPATPGTPPPRNPANPLQPPPPHGGHM